MKIALKNIRPNIHRDFSINPIRQDKVDALVKSMEINEPWVGLIARPMEDGTFQLAFGHHRAAALEKYHEGDMDATIEIDIKDLDDAQMLRHMLDENMEGRDLTVSDRMEAVTAVVNAFASGLIEIPHKPHKPHNKRRTHIRGRLAPSFKAVWDAPHDAQVYTLKSVAAVVNYATGTTNHILSALADIEVGCVPEHEYTSCGSLMDAKRLHLEKNKAPDVRRSMHTHKLDPCKIPRRISGVQGAVRALLIDGHDARGSLRVKMRHINKTPGIRAASDIKALADALQKLEDFAHTARMELIDTNNRKKADAQADARNKNPTVEGKGRRPAGKPVDTHGTAAYDA